jgi:tRNA U34 5-methylaminomethyl-2-thiouridine-forming methyltransferase MnmC
VERKIIYTADGSHSVSIPGMNVTYHSIHGAIQESKHIFIEAGLKSIRPLAAARCFSIFEMGFGTGLNALLTLIEAEKLNRKIYYESVELFPLSVEEAKSLNYCSILQRNDLQKTFEDLHICEWGKKITVPSNFILKKTKTDLLNFQTSETCLSGRQAFELIFFDAFAPNAQPELWTEEIFQKLYSILKLDGILVTYCSKGIARRAMQAAGFIVEKIPGPPGKREMIRAMRVK